MITFGEYGPEKNLVNEFIRYCWDHPVSIEGVGNRHLFCWGYELWLAPGRNISDGGKIDLVATDDTGMVWLIEAKLHNNPELCAELWQNQVIRYRKALSDMPPTTWVSQTRRYLTGASASAPSPSFLDGGCDSLVRCFILWCKHLGVSLPQETGRKLYQMTETAIAQENIVGAVMADVARLDVWQSRPQDGHRYGYIALSGTGQNMKVAARMDSAMSQGTSAPKASDTGDRLWTDLLREKRGEPATPESVRSLISAECMEQYDLIIERIKAMGWNGDFRTGTKSFTIWLKTIYGEDIGIMLGLVDLDGQFNSIKHKLPGEGAFKCDISLKPFRHKNETQKIGMDIAQRFIREARYRGRGIGDALRSRHLNSHEQAEWSWILHHWVNNVNRDFTGLQSDKKDVVAAMDVLASIVAKSQPQPNGSKSSRKRAEKWDFLLE